MRWRGHQREQVFANGRDRNGAASAVAEPVWYVGDDDGLSTHAGDLLDHVGEQLNGAALRDEEHAVVRGVDQLEGAVAVGAAR